MDIRKSHRPKSHEPWSLPVCRTIQNKGTRMKQFLLVTASSLALVSAAAAADLPTRQPPPPTPVVGKAPIGKAPIGKAPIGKAPIGKAPIVTKG